MTMTATFSGWEMLRDYRPAAASEIQRFRVDALPAGILSRPIETWKEMAQDALLNQIAGLRDGWDGGSAHGFSSAVISNALSVLARLRLYDYPPDLILPSFAGTIEFEWQRPSGNAHMELGNSTYGFYTEPSVGEPIMEGGSVEVLNVEKIRDALVSIEETLARPSVEDWNRPMGNTTRSPGRAA